MKNLCCCDEGQVPLTRSALSGNFPIENAGDFLKVQSY